MSGSSSAPVRAGRPGAPDRHRRRRHERHRPDPAGPRGRGVRVRREAVPRRAGPAGAGRPDRRRSRPGPPARRPGHGGGVLGHPPGQPGAGRRPRARPGRGAPGPCAGRAHRGPPAGRGHRHRRQDLDHVDAHGGPAALRAGPVLRHRRRPDHLGLRCARGHRGHLRGRGGRVRRVLPGLLPAGRGGHQRGGRPPGPLRQRDGLRGRVRDLPGPDRARRRAGDLRRRPGRRRAGGHRRAAAACASCGTAGPRTATRG